MAIRSVIIGLGTIGQVHTECYLYWSCYMTESDKYLKKLWEQYLDMEIGHLDKARQLLQKYEKKDYQDDIGEGDFPKPLSLHENVEYIRNIIKNTVQFTSKDIDYVNIDTLKDDDRFFQYQNVVNRNGQNNASHIVIKNEIGKRGMDYRYCFGVIPVYFLKVLIAVKLIFQLFIDGNWYEQRKRYTNNL